MRILIVEHNVDLAQIWAGFLRRSGVEVEIATTQKDAIASMRFHDFDALVVELVLPDGGAIAISDYASYRYPDVPIVTVTDSRFFSDGSIFEVIPNARGIVRHPVGPGDLAAMLDHYSAQRGRKTA